MATTPQAPAPNECGSCAYYHSTNSTCHRYPPPKAEWAAAQAMGITTVHDTWPMVQPSDWCGEYG